MRPSIHRQLNEYLNLLLVVLAFSIPLVRSWVSISVPLVALLWLLEGRLRTKIATLRSHVLTLAIVAFILLNLLSLLWSSDPGAGISYVAEYRYLLLVPIIATSLREPFHSRLTAAYVAGSTIAVLASLAVFFGVYRTAHVYPGNPSPTMSHLDFSMVLALAALISLNRIAHGRPHRLIWGALLALHVVGLVVNIGRSGQLAFAGTLCVMVPLYLGRRSRTAAGAGLLAVVVALCLSYVSVPRLHGRIDSAVQELDQTLTQQRYQGNLGKRIAGMVVTREMIAERPVLGTGAGAAMIEFRRLLDTRFRDLKPSIYWFPHLHNQYLQVTAELGLVGLCALLAIFLALIGGPYYRTDDRDLAVIVCCVYLLGFLGDPFLHKQLTVTSFSLFAGIAAARGRSLSWTGPASRAVGGDSAS
jgi:O-antigen ligase